MTNREYLSNLTSEKLIDWLGAEHKEEPKEHKEEPNKQNDKVEIGTVTPGTVVKVKDVEVIVLDTHYSAYSGIEGVFCLMKGIAFDMAFSKDNNNNWKKSSLRAYLHDEWPDGFEIRSTLLLFERDLTSDDGLKDYGTCFDYVSLISDDEYRHYREHIKNKTDWWWTLTPYSTLPDYTNLARFVYSDGSRNYYDAYYGAGGASPAFCFSRDTLVEVCDEG